MQKSEDVVQGTQTGCTGPCICLCTRPGSLFPVETFQGSFF